MRSTAKRLAHQCLRWYGCEFPSHPGKWRVVERVVEAFRLYEGEPTPVVATRGGVLLELDLREYMDRTVYYLGTHEEWDSRVFAARLRPDDVVCDVGANMGWYTLAAARMLQGTGNVHAFEPHPEAFKRLCRNIELNAFSNVFAHQCALSDGSGTGVLVNERDSDTAWVAIGGAAASDKVPVTTLDEFAARMALSRLDAVKVDVEGSEVAFLRGAARTLERFRPFVLIEVHEGNLARSGTSPQELLGILLDLDYALYRANRRGLEPLAEVPRGPRVINVIAINQVAARDRASAP